MLQNLADLGAMDPEPKPSYEFGPFRLEGREQRVLRNGRLVPLSPKVFDLLWVLVTQAGHLLEKERLLSEIWPDSFVEEANLNRSISVLRKALGESDSERYIETVPKRGYRFVAPVRAIPPAATDASGMAEPERPVAVKPRSMQRRAAAIAVVIAMFAAAAALYTMFRGRSAEPPRTPSAIHRQLTFTGGAITPALSPDGTRIAYVSKESPERKLMVLALDGSAARLLFTAPEIGTLRWSPDSAELTFWARGNGADGFYIAPHSAAGVRKISSGPFVSAWSPDGSTIALALFVSGHIAFVNRLGELQRRIALRETREWIWDLDWSASHDRLLFVADDAQQRPTIWVIGTDGRNQTRIYTGDTEILAARWAPAGDAAYYFTRVNQTVSLYKVRVAADADRTPRLLISGLETDEGFGISADGRRLVYTRAPYYSNLWIVDAPPAGDARQPVRRRQLTQATAVLERPRVSPDATTVVFNMGYESRADLYTVPVTGGTPRQLTFMKAFSVGGAWSPAGRSIAFASTEGGQARVWLVNADGTAPRPLPSADLSESYDVTWAPGRRIVYQQTGNRNFFVLDPATQRTKPLISDGLVGWASSAVYSPDGRTIAISWNRRPTRGIWLLDPETSRETLVYAAQRPSDPFPFPIGWSPDGNSVYAVIGTRAAYRGVSVSFEETLTAVRIVRVPVKGGRLEAVVSLPFEEVGGISMFPDGRRFVCAVYFSRSDVWAVDDFDPSVSPASR